MSSPRHFFSCRYIKKNNFQVRCFDINIELFDLLKGHDKSYWDFKEHYHWETPDGFAKILPLIQEYLDKKVEEILAYGAQIIGFTVFYPSVLSALYLAEKIKKRDPSKKIILGGPECYKDIGNFTLLKNDFIDAVVFGEGEATLPELVDLFKKSGSLENIPGVLTKNGGGFLNGGFRSEIKNLDDLPIPDFDDYNLKLYKKFSLPVMTSRGCIARCTFCGEVSFWKNFRSRSAEHIFRELKHDVEKFGVRELCFNDSLINGNLRELSRLADLILENKLEIIRGGYARINKAMDLELLKKLKKAGCYFLSYGIESGSPKVICDMNKKISLKDAEKNLADTTKAGIETHVNWMVGFPTENAIDFLKSLIFILKTEKIFFISILARCLAAYRQTHLLPKTWQNIISSLNLYLAIGGQNIIAVLLSTVG